MQRNQRFNQLRCLPSAPFQLEKVFGECVARLRFE
jgi:hypothetical protein